MGPSALKQYLSDVVLLVLAAPDRSCASLSSSSLTAASVNTPSSMDCAAVRSRGRESATTLQISYRSGQNMT